MGSFFSLRGSDNSLLKHLGIQHIFTDNSAHNICCPVRESVGRYYGGSQNGWKVIIMNVEQRTCGQTSQRSLCRRMRYGRSRAPRPWPSSFRVKQPGKQRAKQQVKQVVTLCNHNLQPGQPFSHVSNWGLVQNVIMKMTVLMPILPPHTRPCLYLNDTHKDTVLSHAAEVSDS